jgi:hypothetical protein
MKYYNEFGLTVQHISLLLISDYGSAHSIRSNIIFYSIISSSGKITDTEAVPMSLENLYTYIYTEIQPTWK